MAAKEAEKKEAEAPAATSGGGAPSKLPLILSVVNLLATMGILAVVAMSFSKESKKPQIEDIIAEGGEPAAEEGGGGHGAPAGGHGGGHGGGEKAAKTGNQKMVTIEQFTVNLNSAGSVNPKFATVYITVEVLSDDTAAEMTQKMPQVRNTIIDLFNSKKPSDVATVEGREYLKQELKNAFNTFLTTGKVKSVFFTNFALSS